MKINSLEADWIILKYSFLSNNRAPFFRQVLQKETIREEITKCDSFLRNVRPDHANPRKK